MEPLENKLKELFQTKKRMDEQSIPDFALFRKKMERAESRRKLYVVYRIAASFLFVACALWFYFISTNEPASFTQKIPPLDLNKELPTQILMHQTSGSQFLWQWKSPTDKLLETGTPIGTIYPRKNS